MDLHLRRLAAYGRVLIVRVLSNKTIIFIDWFPWSIFSCVMDEAADAH
jgi:hypothetical protein